MLAILALWTQSLRTVPELAAGTLSYGIDAVTGEFQRFMQWNRKVSKQQASSMNPKLVGPMSFQPQ